MSYVNLTFNVNEVIWGQHVPFVETNSFNERKLINDLQQGKVKIGVACERNDFFNTRFDHWLLKLKHEYKLRWLANFLAHTINRYIVMPRNIKRLEKHSNSFLLEYFLTFDKKSRHYKGLLASNINNFLLVIFTTRDKWDGRVYCLPTNLTTTVNEDGELSGSGENSSLYFAPTSLKTKDLIFGKRWGKVERLEHMQSMGS